MKRKSDSDAHRLADLIHDLRGARAAAADSAAQHKRAVDAIQAEVWRLSEDVRTGQRGLLDDLPTQVRHVDPPTKNGPEPPPLARQAAAGSHAEGCDGHACETWCECPCHDGKHPTTRDPILVCGDSETHAPHSFVAEGKKSGDADAWRRCPGKGPPRAPRARRRVPAENDR